jgi:CRISPR-associated endoribonuclease Cas6
MNNYYEMIVAVTLEEDLKFLNSYEFIANMISRAMLNDEMLKTLHISNNFKYYTFCSFEPLERDKIYRKGRIYITRIRSLSSNFLLALKKLLPRIDYPVEIVAMEIHKFPYRQVSQLVAVTPVIATVFDRCWTKEDGLLLLRERAHINAFKKYRDYFGDMKEPKDNFIEYIRQINNKPIKIPYKNVSLLGNKLIIGVKEDEVSQKLAFTVLGSGLLEKNAIGMGYCIAR